MTYKLTLTEEQYNHIAQCVETCHRIACGDIRQLRDILPVSPDDFLLDEIKRQSFPELAFNEYYGWDGGYRGTTYNENFRKAFDLFQARGYQIYREMIHVRTVTKGLDDVYSSPTLTTHKAQRPVIEVIP